MAPIQIMKKIVNQIMKRLVKQAKFKSDKKKLEKLSKIASEAPIASEATQSAVKKGLCKHKNPIAFPECGKLMKNERGVKQHITEMHE
ncbi:hypothetical protein BpHYR1_022457 [Brachionus plicatilis]|uniref:C2H2-type domain-containing protein n=1 Tax=Brachionus plicatilis TaxID=10195 RepID=A0A3M7R049_BRAPC|nr:hypothetical protein BpHYR1_022457 [Brachionus plicatilis]